MNCARLNSTPYETYENMNNIDENCVGLAMESRNSKRQVHQINRRIVRMDVREQKHVGLSISYILHFY